MHKSSESSRQRDLRPKGCRRLLDAADRHDVFLFMALFSLFFLRTHVESSSLLVKIKIISMFFGLQNNYIVAIGYVLSQFLHNVKFVLKKCVGFQLLHTNGIRISVIVIAHICH